MGEAGSEYLDEIGDKQTYIMANYVKFLEQSGARVVPIDSGGDHEAEIAKLDHLNGLLLAGGANDLLYTAFVRKLYQKAMNLND